VYSYINNSQAGSNPFPIEEVGGRKNMIAVNEAGVPVAGLAWWDEKDERVAARTANAKAKADKKAQKAAEAPVVEAEEAEVQEAE
jgi:hypothetical protein